MAKQSVDIITKGLENPAVSAYTSPKQAKRNYESSYNASADTYAYILWKENKSAEAMPYMKTVYDRTSDEENSIEHYAEILGAAGQYAKAMEVIEHGYSLGQYSDVYKTELKKDYIALKGSDKGFDAYVAPMENKAKAKILADLAKTMINEPAPAFTLKDFDGKTVSLADLKGKVVIVDFWATWCGPCYAAFPSLIEWSRKFEKDGLVILGVTRFYGEAEGVQVTEAKETEYLQQFKKTHNLPYAFVVGKERLNQINYGANSLPTTVIIDRKGVVRYVDVGAGKEADIQKKIEKLLAEK